MGLKYCDKCQEPVEQIVMVCPKCKSEMFVHGKASSPKTTSAQTKVASTAAPTSTKTSETFPALSKTGKTIDDLIRAQNRTTHAVRAFVRFLFIQLTGITCAVFLWNVSLAMNGNASIEFLAGIVWLGAVIWSSAAGWDELNKSNID